jgi:hypothetical protein
VQRQHTGTGVAGAEEGIALVDARDRERRQRAREALRAATAAGDTTAVARARDRLVELGRPVDGGDGVGGVVISWNCVTTRCGARSGGRPVVALSRVVRHSFGVPAWRRGAERGFLSRGSRRDAPGFRCCAAELPPGAGDEELIGVTTAVELIPRTTDEVSDEVAAFLAEPERDGDFRDLRGLVTLLVPLLSPPGPRRPTK